MQVVGSISTISAVGVSTSSALLLPAGDRKYAIIHNFSGVPLFVAFAATATSASGGFTVIVADGEAYEIPAVWKGPLSCITGSGSGNVNVTTIE